MAQRFTLTVRQRGHTDKTRFDSAAEAVDALAARLDELAPSSRRGVERAFVREIEPVRQVAVRAEIAGPRVRAGIDLRGDGSAEAYTGRWRRSLIEQRPGETAVDALRRTVGA